MALAASLLTQYLFVENEKATERESFVEVSVSYHVVLVWIEFGLNID